MTDMVKNLSLFSGSVNPQLAEEIASELGVALGWLEELAEGSELGVALGSELGVADGFGLCEGFCSGGGGTSQVSAAFLARS